LQELLYNWRSGAIIAGQTELDKACGDLVGRLEHDKEVEGMWISNNEEQRGDDTMSMCSEGTRDEYERQIDEWNDREGELYVIKGRDWAFRGAVEEIEGEIGPGMV
jgi:hypothetical protein